MPNCFLNRADRCSCHRLRSEPGALWPAIVDCPSAVIGKGSDPGYFAEIVDTVDQPIQPVKQEPALTRLDSGLALEPVLQQSQGTPPREHFRKNPPDQRNDMQPADDRTRACQQGAEHNPQNEQCMQKQN